ncbi:E3 ubiquitin-protein ligase BRE1 [Cucumispora dikerogammari]|nr:E3 ubiquitin-protein ligase BRE1 [Cucumispora dikerogammari]
MKKLDSIDGISRFAIDNIINNEDIKIQEITNILESLLRGDVEIIKNIENNINKNMELSEEIKRLEGIFRSNEEVIKTKRSQIEKKLSTGKINEIPRSKDITINSGTNTKICDSLNTNTDICGNICDNVNTTIENFFNKIILFDKVHYLNYIAPLIVTYTKKQVGLFEEAILQNKPLSRLKPANTSHMTANIDLIKEADRLRDSVAELMSINNKKRKLLFGTTNADNAINNEDIKDKLINLPFETIKSVLNLSNKNTFLLYNKYKIIEKHSIIKELDFKLKQNDTEFIKEKDNFLFNCSLEYKILADHFNDELNELDKCINDIKKRNVRLRKENDTLMFNIKETEDKLRGFEKENEILIKKLKTVEAKILNISDRSTIFDNVTINNIEETLFLLKEYETYKNILLCRVCKLREIDLCIKKCMHLFCADCVGDMCKEGKGVCHICKKKFRGVDIVKIYL